MKAQELRIGNYYLSFGIDLKQVETLSKDKVLIDFNPIPLTEEWLVKFGFEKPAHSWNGKIFHLSEWDKYPLNWCVAMDKNGAVIVSRLKYVHQLQNLYFALTGEELEMK